MAMNMYIVTFKGGYSEEASRAVALQVKRLGGFILMVTRNGPIVAIDDSQAAALNRNPSVEFVGGVSYNPKGVACERSSTGSSSKTQAGRSSVRIRRCRIRRTLRNNNERRSSTFSTFPSPR